MLLASLNLTFVIPSLDLMRKEIKSQEVTDEKDLMYFVSFSEKPSTLDIQTTMACNHLSILNMFFHSSYQSQNLFGNTEVGKMGNSTHCITFANQY